MSALRILRNTQIQREEIFIIEAGGTYNLPSIFKGQMRHNEILLYLLRHNCAYASKSVLNEIYVS